MKKQLYTRTEIFELLWMEAATKVAKRLGISDVGLAKWCKSNDVPKPKLGYWAKRAHGVPVPDKPNLPQWTGRAPEPSITVRIIPEPIVPPREEPIEELPLFSGKTFHPEVLKTFQAEDDGLVNKYGRWIADGGFSVEVGPASLYKAKVILETIVDAMVAKGFEMEDYQGRYRERKRTCFCLGEDRIVLMLYEPSKRLSKPIQKKQSWVHRGEIHSYYQMIEFQGAGNLEIRLDHRDTYPEIVIREKPNRSLEQTLGIAIRVVDELCDEAKERRRIREIERIEEAKERKRLADIKWANQVKAWKWKELTEAAERWHELNKIREFVKAMNSNSLIQRKNKGLKEWASWAEEQINARDPLYKVASGMELPGQREFERPDENGWGF